MKKRILSMLLAIVMVAALLPTVALAEGEPGDHIHYDEHNSLEEGSAEFVVVKQ